MAGILVIGAGPGIGQASARRFARERLPVGVVARKQATLDAAVASLTGTGVQIEARSADVADETALLATLDDLTAILGTPDVVVYNAANVRSDELGELSAQEQLECWAVNVGGAITVAGRVLPAMAERGSGTFLITGGMAQAHPRLLSLSLGKAGVRALASLLDTQYRLCGVHVATVNILGRVAPRTAFDPDEIAEQYWHLHTQPSQEWQPLVDYPGASTSDGR